MGLIHALGSEQGSDSEREVVRLQDSNRERESAEVAEKLRPEAGTGRRPHSYSGTLTRTPHV